MNRDAEENEREGGREKGWKEVRKRERERERERISQTERQIEREAGSPPTFLNSPHTHTHTHTHTKEIEIEVERPREGTTRKKNRERLTKSSFLHFRIIFFQCWQIRKTRCERLE